MPQELSKPSSLAPQTLSALMNGEISAVRMADFLSPVELEAILSSVRRVGIGYYLGDTKADGVERKGKIGPNLFSFKDDLSTYFERLTDFENGARPELFANVDIPCRFASLLEVAADSAKVRRATHQGRPLAECTVRALPSAPLHNDWIVGELPGFDAFVGLQDQFAWNVYITVGSAGGETLIYGTEDRLEAMERGPSVTVAPVPGELVLFRSRNLHEVKPTVGDRITVSGFWGPYDDRTIRYWV